MNAPHIDVIKKAMQILKDRGAVYGGVTDHFTRAASIATLWLDRPISARDVSLILASVKMARIATTPSHEDSFVDIVNYVAFGASFSKGDGVDGLAAAVKSALESPDA
jgi:hypothetical protein